MKDNNTKKRSARVRKKNKNGKPGMLKRITDRLKSKRSVIQFFAVFLSVLGLYYGLVISFNNFIIDNYIILEARIAGAILNLIGQKVTIEGVSIFSDKFSVMLSYGCEGSEPIVIFLAGVLAFPVKWKYKLYGLLAGTLFLYIANIFRIVILLLIGTYKSSVFGLFHDDLLPVLFIILSIIAWSIWIKWSLTATKKASLNA